MRQNLQLVSVPTCQIRVAQPIAPGRLLRRDSRAVGQPIPLLRLHQFCILGPLDSLRIAILARAANTGCTARIDTETGVGSHPNDRWLGVTTAAASLLRNQPGSLSSHHNRDAKHSKGPGINIQQHI